MGTPLPRSFVLDGRYRLGRPLGKGGMGYVYEAEDVRLGRQVAVKVLSREDNQDPALCERLFREAKAAARANHPAIVTVFGYGTDASEGCSYLVLERLEGEDLRQRLAARKVLSLPLCVRIGIELADALDAAHQVGVIHRDLKPSNVFLATRGLRRDEVKLLDFGVAKVVDLNGITATGELCGTLCYMAPEQLQDSKRVDERADLYALGAVLYECLTGRAPIEGESPAQIAAQVFFGTITPPLELRSETPSALSELVMRCLSRRRSERPTSARELRDALVALR